MKGPLLVAPRERYYGNTTINNATRRAPATQPVPSTVQADLACPLNNEASLRITAPSESAINNPVAETNFLTTPKKLSFQSHHKCGIPVINANHFRVWCRHTRCCSTKQQLSWGCCSSSASITAGNLVYVASGQKVGKF
jgi:hypothetical protein